MIKLVIFACLVGLSLANTCNDQNPCTILNSHCENGQCVCDNGFHNPDDDKKRWTACVPNPNPCDNVQCSIQNSHCDNGECVCDDGFHNPDNDKRRWTACVPNNPQPNPC